MTEFIDRVAKAIRDERMAWQICGSQGRWCALRRPIVGEFVPNEAPTPVELGADIEGAEHRFSDLLEIQCARAAIEAMRDPTLAMSLRGMAVVMDEMKVAIGGDGETIDRAYQAMIDAALGKP